MKRVSTLAVALGLALSGAAYAGSDTVQPKASGPVQLTDAQMDEVVGGALITLLVVDAVDIDDNTVNVAIPVNATVAAGVLGSAAAVGTQAGNLTQRR